MPVASIASHRSYFWHLHRPFEIELGIPQTIIRENVQVLVGQTTPIELPMKIATVAETVTVTGAAATVDTTSANVNVTLSKDLLQATPGGRDIWALTRSPGARAASPGAPDVRRYVREGLQGPARGTTSAQNAIPERHSVNVGDPSAIGAAGFYYDFDAFDEVQVSVGAHDITVPTGGVFLNMITKSGTDRWQGQGAYFYSGKNIQAGNVDSTLLNYGFNPITGAVNFVSDGTFNIGGPLSSKVRLFTSFRDWRVHVNTPAALSETLVDQTDDVGPGQCHYQPNSKNTFKALYTRQYYKKPNRFLTSATVPSTNFTSDSVSDEDDVFDVVQGLWNSVITPKLFMNAAFNFNNINFPLKFNGTTQSLTDLSTGILYNNEASQSLAIRRRFEEQRDVQLLHRPGARRPPRIQIRLRLYARAGPDRNRSMGRRGADLPQSGQWQHAGRGRERHALQHSSDLTLVHRRHLVLRTRRVSPQQDDDHGGRAHRTPDVVPSGTVEPVDAVGFRRHRWLPFTLPRSFGDSGNIIQWWNVGPRVSAAYDVTGDGKTALRGSAARYYVLNSAAANPVNLNATYSELYTWNDKNGDMQFQPGEQTGTPVVTSASSTSFDPSFSRPYTNEFTAGFDREVLGDTKLSATFTYRAEKNQQGYLNTTVHNSTFPAVWSIRTGWRDNDRRQHHHHLQQNQRGHPDSDQQRSDVLADLQGRGSHGDQADVAQVADAGRPDISLIARTV